MGHRFISVAKPEIAEKLAKVMRVFGNVVKLEDCVDVPEQVHEVEYFAVTAQQKKEFKIADELAPLVRYGKHHQICGGTIKGNEYEDTRYPESDKTGRVISLAEEHEKLIVVCRYNAEIDMLKVELEHKGFEVYIINGSRHVDQGKVIEELKKKDKYVLLAQAKTCTGWELKECPVMCFYSLDFGLVEYLQGLGRIQRIDNPKKNLYVYLVVKGTVDEKVYQRVAVERKDFHMTLMKDE